MTANECLVNSSLGKKTAYPDTYNKDLLFPIARHEKRSAFNLSGKVPFYGVDTWHAYEISWLNTQGKPMVAMAECVIPAHSPNLIESKSLKLYFNSFNNACFASLEAVQARMVSDLSAAAGLTVYLQLQRLDNVTTATLVSPSGESIDHHDLCGDDQAPNPTHLVLNNRLTTVEETLYSHLFKSNCPVTGQPDWASVQIHYRGYPIDHAGLLRYLVSYRHHSAFHEHCVERIFMDILQQLAPKTLSVYAAYTRRGGLDINPFRSTERDDPRPMYRTVRQ